MVNNYDEYISECKSHPRYFGHMCRTPLNKLLPFHPFTIASGDIMTEYIRASKLAFEKGTSTNKKELEQTNKGKYGNLKAINRIPIAGSSRLVTTPSVDFNRGMVYISPILVSRTSFYTMDINIDGTPWDRYVERSIREGDCVVIMGRLPPITIHNNTSLAV